MKASSKNHVSDELPAILAGEADRDTVLDAAAHLRSCADCQQDLVSAVVAHSALTSAFRFAPEIVALDVEEAAALDAAEPEPAELSRLPDLGPVLERVRDEAGHDVATDDLTAARHRRSARRPRGRTWLAAAAAVIVIGGGGTAATLALTSSSSGTGNVVALAAFPATSGDRATAQLVGANQVRINATSLPTLDAGHQYEVWLTDPLRKSMQSIGYVTGNKTADLRVPTSVLDQYSDIEISVQRLNQVDYSGVSVVRGSYA